MMMTESGRNPVPLLSFPKPLIGNTEEQIEQVMQATVGMYGDLHGIEGKSLQKIEGLEMKALGSTRVEGVNNNHCKFCQNITGVYHANTIQG